MEDGQLVIGAPTVYGCQKIFCVWWMDKVQKGTDRLNRGEGSFGRVVDKPSGKEQTRGSFAS